MNESDDYATKPIEDATPPASPDVAATGVATAIDLGVEVMRVGDRLATIEQRLASLEASVEGAARQIALVPPQVRALGGKLEGVATSITEPRVRDLLNGLVSLYDLIESARRAPAGASEGDSHRRTYEVLRTQLRQILEAHGLSEIPTDGAFQPQLHRALARVKVDEADQDGHVVQVLRAGFRTEQAVLRYAEVAVGYCEETSGGN